MISYPDNLADAEGQMHEVYVSDYEISTSPFPVSLVDVAGGIRGIFSQFDGEVIDENMRLKLTKLIYAKFKMESSWGLNQFGRDQLSVRTGPDHAYATIVINL